MEFPKGQPVCTFQYFRHEKQAALGSREERVGEIRTETDVTPGSPEEQVKVQELFKQLYLDENALLTVRQDLHQRVWEILKKRWTVFLSEAQGKQNTEHKTFSREGETPQSHNEEVIARTAGGLDV